MGVPLLLLFGLIAACSSLVVGKGRWHPDSPHERWAVILHSGLSLPAELMILGGWHIAGHAHEALRKTHFVLARNRSDDLPPAADPATWRGVSHAGLLTTYSRKHRNFFDNLAAEPLWGEQWHLHDYDFPQVLAPASPSHISAVGAWLSGATGQGVQIAVVDDGLQAAHPDIKTNFNSKGSWDFNYDRASVEPTSWDQHGTEAGGCAAAGVNNACGTGVAPSARLAGIRLLASDSVTDEQEALALSYKDQLNQIYSNSWGPIDDGQRLEGPGPLLRAAMKESIERGRNGRGAIYVWAAGNGRMANDNCNFDGYANSRYTITVAAVTSMGLGAPYSEDCSANVVCAPSNGVASNPFKIVTTQLMSKSSNCSFSFGGTSAAAPIVAGVVALMLSARPDLGWRDVQAVLLHSADMVDPKSETWHRNGGGLLFSHTYGYGRANATRAVAMSRTWPLYGPSMELLVRNTSFVTGINMSNVEIVNDIIVESVAVIFSVLVPQRGALAVSLVSPSGMISNIGPTHPDRASNVYRWSFGSVAHWDESSKGTWTLRLEAASEKGEWCCASWELHVYGRTRDV